MEILIPKFNVSISGKVSLEILDSKKRTKQAQHFSNAIHDDLKNAFVNHLASSSGASAFHINTSSNWFASAQSYQASKDGIYIDQNGNNTESQKSYEDNLGNSQWDLKLDSNLSTSYSTNSCTWQAEGTWTGGDGTPSNSSGSFNAMGIGKSFSASSGGDPTFSTMFATASASGDFTAFTLDANDIARVTWTITIN